MTASKSNKKISGWVGLIVIVIIWSIFFYGRYYGRISMNSIVGSGMSPTLNNGDLIVTSQDRKFERFDLVTYKPNPQQNEVAKRLGVELAETRVGRVIGTPTEVIEVTRDAIYINGNKVSSLSIKNGQERTFPKEQIPIDNYFVIMDKNLSGLGEINTNSGIDSRFIGFINSEQMRKVVKAYKASQLPFSAVSEVLSGFSMVLFLVIIPQYIRKVSSKNWFLIVFIIISYVFLGQLMRTVNLIPSPIPSSPTPQRPNRAQNPHRGPRNNLGSKVTLKFSHLLEKHS